MVDGSPHTASHPASGQARASTTRKRVEPLAPAAWIDFQQLPAVVNERWSVAQLWCDEESVDSEKGEMQGIRPRRRHTRTVALLFGLSATVVSGRDLPQSRWPAGVVLSLGCRRSRAASPKSWQGGGRPDGS